MLWKVSKESGKEATACARISALRLRLRQNVWSKKEKYYKKVTWSQRSIWKGVRIQLDPENWIYEGISCLVWQQQTYGALCACSLSQYGRQIRTKEQGCARDLSGRDRDETRDA